MSNEPDKLPYHLETPHKITIYRNGKNPYLYYYFTYNHKMYRGSTGKEDLKSSKDEVFEIFYEVKTGRRREGSRQSSKFGEVCKRFFKYKQENIKKKLSPRTLSEYKRNSSYLLERFSNRDVGTLCFERVYDDYQNWRSKYYKTHQNKRVLTYKRKGKDGKKKEYKGRTLDNVGPVPINRELRLLVSILRYSKDKLGLLDNTTIPPYKILDENSGKRILTDEEFEKLREYMSVNRPYQWSIISFVNSTGCRYPSEIEKITWDCVDWETPCVWIRNRKNPKSGKSVDTPFPLVGEGLRVIQSLWSRDNVPKGPKDKVFVNDKGKFMKNIRKCFKSSLEKCGIENNVCMYSFRHRFTTRMILNNTIPPLMLSKVLGHTSTDMVMKHYQQLDKDSYVKVFQDSMEVYYDKKGEKKNKKNYKPEVKSTNPEPPSYIDLYQQDT